MIAASKDTTEKQEDKKMRNEEAITYQAGEQVTGQDVNTMLAGARVVLKGQQAPSIRISNHRELSKYCLSLIGDSAYEEMRLICVNTQCQVVSEVAIGSGDLTSVSAPIAKIATAALLSTAHCVFLTHNHPGGTCSPSMEDIKTTALIQKALKMFEIQVLDHMIVTPNGESYSMRAHGDLSY